MLVVPVRPRYLVRWFVVPLGLLYPPPLYPVSNTDLKFKMKLINCNKKTLQRGRVGMEGDIIKIMISLNIVDKLIMYISRKIFKVGAF